MLILSLGRGDQNLTEVGRPGNPSVPHSFAFFANEGVSSQSRGDGITVRPHPCRYSNRARELSGVAAGDQGGFGSDSFYQYAAPTHSQSARMSGAPSALTRATRPSRDN